MKHLAVDEFIDFVSMNRMDEQSMELASKVNTHIGECENCLRKLRAFQSVYDEMCKLGTKSDYRKMVYTIEKEFEHGGSKKQDSLEDLDK